MFRKKVRHVGKTVLAEGVKIDLSDLKAVKVLTSKSPKTVGDVRKLTGFWDTTALTYRTFPE